jgi:choline dehydrogenase-like flavoprotein
LRGVPRVGHRPYVAPCLTSVSLFAEKYIFGELNLRVENLSTVGADAVTETDLVIVGGGPAGLTIAREFFGTRTQVLVLESGQLEEDARFTALNAVESVGEPTSGAPTDKRIAFHGANSRSWLNESQAFGVRCRVLGGSSHAWVGKSAAFEDIDFAVRPWVPYSGWPFRREMLDPYLDRAAEALNLGPNCYDDDLWKLIGIAPPQPQFDAKLLRSFFWQFARSRVNHLDIMRFGRDFMMMDSPNVRVLLNATVTRIDTNENGSAFAGLEVSTIEGVRSRVQAKAAVLAASAIENPRLLLLSNGVHPNGLGNQNDLVGRFLMDHPSTRIGHFNADDHAAVVKRFGFYGLRHQGRSHMYMHGLVPSPELQEREQLMHCAMYILEEHAPDEPWDALKRILRAKSDGLLADLITVGSSPVLIAKGLAMRLFATNAAPQWLKEHIANIMIKLNPNFVVREFQSRGLPHKLTGLVIDAITEQRPNPDSRITLSHRNDALGLPLPRADWRIDEQARRSLLRFGHLLAAEFPRVGLPSPLLEDWIAENRPNDGVIIDMGHTAGTTRMSNDPKLGVVNSYCRVHGVAGLYVAGASVFPTCGHANPTLMIIALAIRLADKVKIELSN